MNFLKKMYPKLSLSLLAVVLAYFATINIDFWVYSIFDYDGAVHLKQLNTVLEGITSFHLIKTFSFNLNTGFLYFLTHAIVGLPIYLANAYEALIYVPRIVNSITLLCFLLVSFRLYKQALPRLHSMVLATLPLTFPAVWVALHRFKADLFMSTLLLASVYFLAKDNFTFKRQYWLAVVLFSLALASKTQALIFYPFIGLYCAHKELIHFDFSALKESLLRFMKTLCLNVAIFCLINPYILHPVGFYGFMRRFFWEMNTHVEEVFINRPIFTRLEILNTLYLNQILSLLAVILLVRSIYLMVKQREDALRKISGIAAVFFVINTVYLLQSRHMDFNWLMSYYLILPVMLLADLKQLSQRKSLLILGSMLGLQLLTQYPYIEARFQESLLVSDQNVQANKMLVQQTISAPLPEDSMLLVDEKIPFNVYYYGLTLDNIRYAIGHLRPYRIDEQTFREKWKRIDLDKVKAKVFYEKQYLLLKKDKNINNPVYEGLYTDESKYRLLAENDEMTIWILKSL